MRRGGRPRAAVVVGVALILGAYGALVATAPHPTDTWIGAITGAGILGAVLVARTIGPRP